MFQIECTSGPRLFLVLSWISGCYSFLDFVRKVLHCRIEAGHVSESWHALRWRTKKWGPHRDAQGLDYFCLCCIISNCRKDLQGQKGPQSSSSPTHLSTEGKLSLGEQPNDTQLVNKITAAALVASSPDFQAKELSRASLLSMKHIQGIGFPLLEPSKPAPLPPSHPPITQGLQCACPFLSFCVWISYSSQSLSPWCPWLSVAVECFS